MIFVSELDIYSNLFCYHSYLVKFPNRVVESSCSLFLVPNLNYIVHFHLSFITLLHSTHKDHHSPFWYISQYGKELKYQQCYSLFYKLNDTYENDQRVRYRRNTYIRQVVEMVVPSI